MSCLRFLKQNARYRSMDEIEPYTPREKKFLYGFVIVIVIMWISALWPA